jgi:predicted ATP-dependent endonuclease of OLD family
MKLIKIEIQNFRAINKIQFIAQAYTLLMGANNVGKTTIIDQCLYELMAIPKA